MQVTNHSANSSMYSPSVPHSGVGVTISSTSVTSTTSYSPSRSSCWSFSTAFTFPDATGSYCPGIRTKPPMSVEPSVVSLSITYRSSGAKKRE